MKSGQQQIKSAGVDNPFRAKKSLGQNWLRSEKVRDEIIQTAELTPADLILEIGPGLGFLTEALLKRAGGVVAIEKDTVLVEKLRTRFAPEIASGKLQLFHQDVRDFVESDRLEAKRYKLVANIPYYLTGYILQKFLTAVRPPQSAVLMLQKEVAERILAKGGKESLLSISVKAYGEPRYVKTVPAGAFVPAPKVASAILAIKNISRGRFADAKTETAFFNLLKRGFAKKRKMLKNKLGQEAKFFPACGIDPAARAEDLTLDQWLCLARAAKEDEIG